MFSGKSPATYLSKLFDKEKGEDEEETSNEASNASENNNSKEVPGAGRKRSQSMFAPSVSALLSGDHVGGKGKYFYIKCLVFAFHYH